MASGPDELFLIDGNSLVYRAFFALPESIATRIPSSSARRASCSQATQTAARKSSPAGAPSSMRSSPCGP